MSQPAPVVTRPAPHGRAIGRYLIFGQIGSGGTATVHFGRLRGPAGFSRTVALKRLHTHLAADPHHASLFLAEARLNARIHHPNVVPLLDVVALDGGELLLVMDYVHGETLGGLLGTARRRGAQVPLAVTSAIMTGVLLGLHAAHEARSETGAALGLVHGDVSPHNVIVGADGTARVLDFGIAKVAGGNDNRRVMGTPSYMAPERWRDGGFDRRSDLFGAGVVLWEMLALERLFRSQGEVQSPTKLARPITPPSRVNPAVPAALDAVVLRALQAKPEDRFTTGLAFARALEAACPPATSREVSEWVNDICGHRLCERAAELARIEAVTTAEGIAPTDLRTHTQADESGTAFSLLELDEPPTLKTRGDTPTRAPTRAVRSGAARLRTEDDEPTVVEANMTARLALLQECQGGNRGIAAPATAAPSAGDAARPGLPPTDSALSLEALLDEALPAAEPARSWRRPMFGAGKSPTPSGLVPVGTPVPDRPAMQLLPTTPAPLEPIAPVRPTPQITQPVVVQAPEPPMFYATASTFRVERRRRRTPLETYWPALRNRRAPRLLVLGAALTVAALPIAVVVRSALSARAPAAPLAVKPAPPTAIVHAAQPVSLARASAPAVAPAPAPAPTPVAPAPTPIASLPAPERAELPPALEDPAPVRNPPAPAAESPAALEPPPLAAVTVEEPPPAAGPSTVETVEKAPSRRGQGRRLTPARPEAAQERRSGSRGSRDSLGSLNRRAVQAYEALDLDEALALLQRGLRGRRSNDLVESETLAHTHLYMGVVLAGGFKQPGLAAKHFRTAQSLSPGVSLPRRLISPDVDAAIRQAAAVAASVR